MHCKIYVYLVLSLLVHTALALKLGLARNSQWLDGPDSPESEDSAIQARAVQGMKVGHFNTYGEAPAHCLPGDTDHTRYLDHTNHSLGTFPMRYYYNQKFYAGAGSPIIVMSGYLADASTTAPRLLNPKRDLDMTLAKKLGAAVVVLETRYFGKSSPFTELTVKNLQHLNYEQIVADTVYFAQNVKLPFDMNGTSSPQKAPWMLYGTTSAGDIAAYTASTAPGPYWAYFASSADVQSVSDFWQVWNVQATYMPKNCSSDINAIFTYMDDLYKSGNMSAIEQLKAQFMMQSVSEYRDFMNALNDPVSAWQSISYGNDAGFYEFCDAIEGVNANSTTVPNSNGVGLTAALGNFADYWTTYYLPDSCFSHYDYTEFNDTYNTACYEYLNGSNPQYHHLSVYGAGDRQYNWLRCNAPHLQAPTGPPRGHARLASLYVDVEYWKTVCSLFFPDEGTYTYQSKRTAAQFNQYTGGWNNAAKRLMYIDGKYDSLREAGVTSDIRPGGPLQSTADTPVVLNANGWAGSELRNVYCLANPECVAVRKQMIQQALTWAAEFVPAH